MIETSETWCPIGSLLSTVMMGFHVSSDDMPGGDDASQEQK